MSVLTVTLRLPDGVTDAPHGGRGEYEGWMLLCGDEDEQENHESDVHNTRDAHDNFSGHVSCRYTNTQRTDHIGGSQCDHYVSNVLYS